MGNNGIENNRMQSRGKESAAELENKKVSLYITGMRSVIMQLLETDSKIALLMNEP